MLPLGMGTTAADFHIAGIAPHLIDRLKRRVMEGVILDAVYFNILTEIPSVPELLLTSIKQIRSKKNSLEPFSF